MFTPMRVSYHLIKSTMQAAALFSPITILATVQPAQAWVVMQDNFDSGKIEGWDVDLSPSGATIEAKDGAIVILARERAYAHIERPNSEDNITVCAKFRVYDSNSTGYWAAGIVLYWNAGDWTRVSLDALHQRISVTDMVHGSRLTRWDRISESDLYAEHWLAIELTPSWINVYRSIDGEIWTRLLDGPRPGTFEGAPVRILLGQGYGTGYQPYANPDLDNDCVTLGNMAKTSVDDLVVRKDELLAGIPFLRDFPFPYKSALTIASDVDATSREEFLKIHQFLNTKQNTSMNPDVMSGTGMGIGVGLEIAGSFWMYSDATSDSIRGISYFDLDGSNITKSLDSDLVRTYAHAGYLDCLHSYGHFGNADGFTRGMAIEALAEMERSQIVPSVWSNHGDGFEHQNIGHRRNPKNLGDLPGSKAYHSDLTLWPTGPVLYLWQYNGGIVHTPTKNPVWIEELYDGNKAYVFSRYYGPGWQMEDLADQLSQANLERLASDRGYMVVANHFRAMGPSRVLDEQTIEALRLLENMHRSGDIYVTTTSKLLTYKTVRDGLRWTCLGCCDSVITIAITGIADAFGDDVPPTLETLQGITFYTYCPTRLRVLLGDEEVTNQLVVNPPDYTNTPSVSFPLMHLPAFPEWTTNGYTRKTEDYAVNKYDYKISVCNVGLAPHSPIMMYVGLHAFDIAAVRQGDLYHISVPDSATVRLPLLQPGECIDDIEILNGTYSPDIPRLIRSEGDSCKIVSATYQSAEGMTSLRLVGSGQSCLEFANLKSPFLGARSRFAAGNSQTAFLDLCDERTFHTVSLKAHSEKGAVDILVREWDESQDHFRRWTHSPADGKPIVYYGVGGLTAKTWYKVTRNGAEVGMYTPDSQGNLTMSLGPFDISEEIELSDLKSPDQAEFWLSEPLPNPFRPAGGNCTTSFFATPVAGLATVRVFDSLGRLVAVLQEGPTNTGIHTVEWDGSDREGQIVPSGVYFLRVQASGSDSARKIIVTR